MAWLSALHRVHFRPSALHVCQQLDHYVTLDTRVCMCTDYTSLIAFLPLILPISRLSTGDGGGVQSGSEMEGQEAAAVEGAGEDVMRQMMGEFEKMGEKEVRYATRGIADLQRYEVRAENGQKYMCRCAAPATGLESMAFRANDALFVLQPGIRFFA